MVLAQSILDTAQSLKKDVWSFSKVLRKKIGTDEVWILTHMVDWESYPDRYIVGVFLDKEEGIANLPPNRLEREIRGKSVFYDLEPCDPTSSKEERKKRGEREMEYYEYHGTHGNGLLILEKVSLTSLCKKDKVFYRDLLLSLLGFEDGEDEDSSH